MTRRFSSVRPTGSGPVRAATFTAVGMGLAGQLVLAVSGILAARILGVEDRGNLALLMLVPILVSQLGLVLPITATYYIARRPSAAGAVARALRVPAVGQMVGLTILHAGILWIVLDDPGLGSAPALVSLAAVPGLLAQQYGQAILQGLQRFREFNLLRILPAIFYALLCVGLFLADAGDLPTLMLAWVVAMTGVSILTLAVALRRLPAASTEAPPRREMLRFGARAWLGTASPGEYLQLDQAIAAALLSRSALGLYVVAIAVTNLPRFVAQSVGMIAFPSTAGSLGEARRVMWRFCLLTLLLCAPLVLALELALGELIPFLFGSEFDSAVSAARILLLASLILGIRRVLTDASRGAGHPGLGSVAEVVAVTTLLSVGIPLASTWGIEGVATAMAASAGVSLAVLVAGLTVGPHLHQFGLGARVHGGVRVAVLAILAGAGAGAIVVLLGLSALGADPVVVPATTCVVALSPLVWRVVRGRFDLFEPIVFGALMLAVLFGVRPLWTHATGEVIYASNGFFFGQDLPRAALLGLIATTAFVVGYELVYARRRPPSRPPRVRLDPTRIYIYAGLITALALGLYSLHLSLGGSLVQGLSVAIGGRSEYAQSLFAGSSEYLSAAPILAACAAILVVLARGGHLKFRHALIALALAAIPCALFFFGGGRRFIVPALAVPVVAAYLMSRRRPRIAHVAVVLPVLFLVLATIPYARSEGDRQQSSGGLAGIYERGLGAPLASLEQFLSGPDTEGVAVLAMEMDVLERPSDYQLGGATVGDLLLQPIPSSLFPGKPLTAHDQLLTKLVGGGCDPVGGGCPVYTAAGTLYHDLWYPGVILGMVLLGAFSAMVWRRQEARPGDPRAVLLAASWTVFVPILMRSGVMPPFAWFLYFYLPCWVGLRLSLRHEVAPASERKRRRGSLAQVRLAS